MKFSSISVIVIVFLISLTCSVEAQDNTKISLLDNDHYVIVGHIYEPYTQDNIVILTNNRTNEQLEVKAINCKHSLKVYLFNLANLEQGWNNKDIITISYGNLTKQLVVDNINIGIQADINEPNDYIPISVIVGGALILASGGGYYYIRRKNKIDKNNIETNENNIETKGSEINMDNEEIQTDEKRSLVDVVFGGTKKAILFMMVLTIIVSTIVGKPVPEDFVDMATYLLMIYFGAGGVKLGIDMQKKS